MSVTTVAIHPDLFDALVALGIDAEEISADSLLRDDLDIDSAELVELVATVSGGSPDGKALKSVRTVAELQQFLGLV